MHMIEIKLFNLLFLLHKNFKIICIALLHVSFRLNIRYHSEIANVVADALTKKSSNNIAALITSSNSILEELQRS